jgi:hypothetical protein
VREVTALGTAPLLLWAQPWPIENTGGSR